ncbi:MAG: DUF4381 family protein [Lysobacterales bacterium]
MQASPPPIRDIHAAAAPPGWPPAWGWWVLGGMLVIALIAAAILLWKRYRKRRRVAQLNAELTDITRQYRTDGDIRVAVASIAVYLRRLILHEGRFAKPVALTGQPWIEFLTQPEDLEPHLAVAAKDLVSAPYQREPQANVDSLIQLCEFWVQRVARV